METGKPELIAQMNKTVIVRLLKQYGRLSRADLTRMLNMSFPSVSSNTRQLIEDNYIVEIGEAAGKNGLGRRSVLLGFNERRGYVVGVCFNINKIITACADLLGTPLAVVEKRMDLSRDGEYAYGLICASIREALAESGVSTDKLECICVGIPGIFDEKSRKNRFVPYLKAWEDIQIADRLKKDFVENVIVENVVNLGVIGEKWKGNAQEYHNIAFIEYDVGISAGLMFNDELYRGAGGLAGEVGYMVLSSDQMSKEFSDMGALEELISEIVTSAMSEEERRQGRESFDIAPLIALCDMGEKRAEKVIEMIVENISAMIINTIVVLNPEIVILSGHNGIQIAQRYMKKIVQAVKTHAPALPEIKISKYTSNQAGLYGALRTSIMNAASNIDNAHYI
ncbi:MAG: ROK family transcriptional regulator [Eubacteriales bacterium]|nr:ROK family transcriptional regulator [Eubacteriales bacterium]